MYQGRKGVTWDSFWSGQGKGRLLQRTENRLHSSSYRKQLEQNISAIKMTTAFRYVFHLPFRMKMSPDFFLEELSTESSLEWSKQLAEWLQ